MEFFPEFVMFQKIVVEKVKIHVEWSVTFFRKSCPLWDNVEKYGRARQTTNNNIKRCINLTCWVNNATDTHSEYVIHTAFARQQWVREHSSMLRLYVRCLPCSCEPRS